jgi:CrcB protein
MTYVLIAIGGAAGALLRYALDSLVFRLVGGSFPYGTLLVNVSGSFVVGLLYQLVVDRSVLPPGMRPALMIGVIGAYTTFSTWMLETVRLLDAGTWIPALVNVGGAIALGLIAVIAGMALGRVL